MFNHSVKGQLAKLLATEDLIVEHRQCDTASFDVHNRILTLPMWQKASESVYDMLVAHEVGHALFTPDEEVNTQSKVPHQYVNVTEDARIEKLMKRRYAGLPKTFYRGYNELYEDDFFSIEDEDVNSMSLADRINLYFKIGSFINIDFTAREKVIVDMVDKAETFQDALEAAIALWEFGKKELEESPTKEQKQNVSNDGQSGQTNQSSESFESGDSDSESGKGDEESYGGTAEQDTEQVRDQGGNNGGEVKTADSLNEKVQNLSEKSQYWGDPFYFEIPKLNLDSLIVKASTIHEYLDGFWDLEMERTGLSYSETFSEVDKQFAAYKKDAQREVNYLVKEFECKKSADAYARTSTSKTGVLDTSKLHTYKFNDDLFKRISITKDGKNHGLIFVLDWSGSMHRQMLPTLKQLFNLVWFCKKTNIPFEVYAFTNEWNHRACDRMEDGNIFIEHCEKKDGYMTIPDGFSMLNILSSTTKTKDFDIHIRNMFRLGVEMEVYNTYKSTPYSIPYRLNLSGTPLNEAIASLHTIIPDFAKKTKTEKVHCVVLTDGEACNSTRNVAIKRNFDDAEYVGTRSIGQNGYLRCRKTGNTYAVPNSWWQITNLLVQNVRDCFPGMNMIGIRVLENRDFRNWIRRMELPLSSENDVTKVWVKEKSISVSSALGYSEVIGISGNSLEASKEFDPVENATKAQILASFKKSYGGKKTNKKILSKFVSVIA